MDQWQRQSVPPLRALWHHGIAVVACVTAVLLRWEANPLLGTDAPFVLLYPAIVALAFLYGRWPALSGAVAGVLTAIASFQMSRADSLQGLIVVLTSVFVSWMITRRQGLEVALSQSERRFRSLVEGAPVGIIQIGPDNRLLTVNPALCHLLGYRCPDLIGRQALDIVYPEDRPAANRETRRLLDGSTDRVEGEIRLQHRDGTPIWVCVVSTALRDAAGRLLYRIAVIQDVRERRQAADTMAQAVRIRDEFLAIASHELRTPLTSLQLHLDSLIRRSQRRRDGEPLPDWALRKLTAAEQQVIRLTTLTGELLDVSRLTAGNMPLSPEPVDVARLLATVAERSRSDLAAAHCELTLSAPAGLIAHWDRSRVEQIVTNLLTNALKYGSGRPIHLTAEQADDTAVIRVTDQGIGIDAETQQRIFDRFERGVSHRNYGGFGVGLWIARQAATALGGTIAVQSRPGEGATFTVRLPLHPEGTATADESA